MYIIQSGQLWIQQEMDKSTGGTFVIDKLYRGSIINHNSFLMNDDMDTDAYCKTNLHTYFIHIDQINALRSKYIEFDEALDKVERELVDENKREPAIDYIIEDEASKYVTKYTTDGTGKKKLRTSYRYSKTNIRTQ